MTNDKTESQPASELDHLLSKFFKNTRRKNGEENELATISRFQRSIKRYLTEENIHSTYSKKMKIREA